MEQHNEDYTCVLDPKRKEDLLKFRHVSDYILTEEQLRFMDENGYVLLKGIVENELCEKIVSESFERARKMLGLKREDEKTWKAAGSFGIADIWNLPSLFELRQNPKLYAVFCQLLDTHKMTVSIDRVGMKPPCRDGEENNKDLTLHTDLNLWDSDPSQPQFQGGLCLRDCPAGGGGFFCIPRFHKREVINNYKKAYQAGKFGRSDIPGPSKRFNIFEDKEFARENMIEIPMEQGDFVIWNSNLPHNGGKNTLKNHWRLHAYVRFVALDGPYVDKKTAKWNADYKQVVCKSMKTGIKPTHYSTGNTVKTNGGADQEVPYHTVPKLTWLGERLFGVKWANTPEEEIEGEKPKELPKKSRVQGGWSK